jgi:acyl-homoserine-lactone acylase
MRSTSVRAGLCAATLALLSTTATAQSSDARAGYKAQVLRTSYGIPHVSATDWGSLGYGYGYAFAQDNVCVLARDVLVASGTQSRWFGPGATGGNFNADRVYKMVNSAARVDAAWSSLDRDTRELLTGYAAGYNRYLRDTPASALPAECRSQPWVQPITGRDSLRVLRKLLVRAGTGNFIAGLVVAAPPVAVGATDDEDAPAFRFAADLAPELDVDLDTLPDFSVERFGSNAVALGSDYTRGAGALLGNPHFPWFGIERFYPVHLTIPGRYDVMGASIYGFPLVNIGFNRDLAWSHTVSTARRFVLRQLALVAGRPTAYLYDGVAQEMTPEIVSVEVREADGTLSTRNHTFWMTRFGPVVVPAAGAGWTATQAFALTDINLENIRAFVQYREMGQARNLEEFRAILDRHAGLPWVNTIAADRGGNAYYGDVGSMPNASNAKLLACIRPGVAQALALGRVYALDGSTSACDLGTDADAPEPGIFGASNMPSLLRRDFAQNSNDSYWLANPAAPLEGYSQIIGTDERRPQNFRTRLGITQLRDRAAGIDGLPGSGFNRQWLQDVLYGNRHYSAEILLDDVLGLCATQDPNVTLPVGTVNVTAACDVLARWDRRNLVDSVGTHVWTEFTRRTVPTNAGAPPTPGAGLPALTSASFYRIPFDAADPVNTPSGIAVANPTVVSRVMGELAYTVKFFADNGIPLDRPWGAVQFDVRNGERIPIHGGSGVSGVYNAIAPGAIVPTAGFTPILAGSSWIQSVTFTPSGPEARAIATYSLSTDPANPHYADMTRLFSGYGWVALPFAERDIRRDPNLKVTRISERLR